MNTEQLIISSLVHNTEYRQKTLPYIKAEYFESPVYQKLFQLVETYHTKYNSVPSQSAFEIEVENIDTWTEDQYRAASEFRDKLYSDRVREEIEKASVTWLVDKSEKYCLDRSVYTAITESVAILSNESKKSKEQIPDMLRDALAVTFDHSVGHDYLHDYADRVAKYKEKIEKIPLPLSMLQSITKGGFERKTINFFIAPTGVGKTLALTYCASQALMEGYNVLYVTLEMAEERIAERIDAALFDVTLDTLKDYMTTDFDTKIKSIKGKTAGTLTIKEFPTGSINANNLRALIDELGTKKGVKPDIVCIDYLGLMNSVRMKSADQSYSYLKAVTEEVRGVAVDKEICIMTAHQTNRSGQGASDFGLTEISDSAGISFTADFMIGIISTDELEKLGHLRFKQLKNRYGPMYPGSFIVGVNRSKMQLFDVDTPHSISAPVNNGSQSELLTENKKLPPPTNTPFNFD